MIRSPQGQEQGKRRKKLKRSSKSLSMSDEDQIQLNDQSAIIPEFHGYRKVPHEFIWGKGAYGINEEIQRLINQQK